MPILFNFMQVNLIFHYIYQMVLQVIYQLEIWEWKSLKNLDILFCYLQLRLSDKNIYDLKFALHQMYVGFGQKITPKK